MTDISDRVQMHDVSVLSSNKYVLRKADFSLKRNDGTWQRMQREVYDRGNGAAILLHNIAQGTVVLIRQFRVPAYLGGYREMLLEAPAGMLDGAEPEERIRKETGEETGFHIAKAEKIFEAFMSPGSMTEILHFFVAPYTHVDRQSAGGGLADEGEDIDVLELPFDDAYAMIAKGGIVDAKTIMLLQWAKLNLFGR